MALKQKEKSFLAGNLANPGNNKDGSKLSVAAIFPVDIDGNIIFNSLGLFLLNPTTWEESKGSNWNPNIIPGQSDPILQWVGGSSRTVTFEALVTNDTSLLDLAKQVTNKSQSTTDKVLSATASIASSFFKVSVPSPRFTTVNPNDAQEELDISDNLNFYRSLVYPTYDDITKPNKLKQSPPIIALFAGTALIKVPYNLTQFKVNPNNDLWVMTNLRIRITKQLPSLAPMEATVTFDLMQYNLRSFDRGRWLLNTN
jgi:hypothetical protein